MSPDTVHHIGLLVADIDAARLRWAEATGYTLSPVTRYSTSGYRDLSNPEPHEHDARICFSFEGEPYLELMAQTGEGTHSARHGEGGHHLGFPVIPDTAVRTEELAKLGVAIDGENIQDGRSILMFTDRNALSDVHLEYVEAGHDHPDMKLDGSPVNRLPNGDKTLFELETVERLTDAIPGGPLITDVGVVVADLDAAVRAWEDVTDYTFTPGGAGALDPRRAVVSSEGPPRVRLVESAAGQDEGLTFFVLTGAGELETRLASLARAGVQIEQQRSDESGRIVELWTRGADLNGIQLRYVS